jgi:hypothetical protein
MGAKSQPRAGSIESSVLEPQNVSCWVAVERHRRLPLRRERRAPRTDAAALKGSPPAEGEPVEPLAQGAPVPKWLNAWESAWPHLGGEATRTRLCRRFSISEDAASRTIS